MLMRWTPQGRENRPGETPDCISAASGSGNSMHGILLVDKPEGLTSNQVVRAVKKQVKPAKVGHSGTLDPAATGLMVVLIGAGTRALDYLNEHRKVYRLSVFLGEETDTDDKEGQVLRRGDASGITAAMIEHVLARYRGVLDQVPPRYSAVKKNGVALYRLARKGDFPDVPARKIEVFALEMTRWAPPILDLELICSKGTYARAIARDLGRDLDVGGRLERLRRISSGPFHVQDAISMDDVSHGGPELIRERLISLADALAHIPDLPVSPSEAARLMRGTGVTVPRGRFAAVNASAAAGRGLLKIVSGDRNLVILVRPQPKGADILIQPARVFNMGDD